MGIAQTKDFISVDDYIEGEQVSEVRHEYIGGQVYAMSGGSEAHNMISLNLASALREHFRGQSCKVFMADMKLRLDIADDDIFYYPDLLVSCDPSDDAKYYKTKPIALVEVLSPSTERLDRREKFLSYQRLASLEEYVLISQEQMRVTLFQRKNEWKPEHFSAPHQRLELPSLDFEQSLAAIYEDVLKS
jgi:Uma2 family endonuclease